jgi:transcriptional regulator with XRE-family HTH domain
METPGADNQDSARTLGELIRSQREMHELSVRQFAAMVGISNPYLSQIERNLRAPSDAVLEAIASELKMSAETLYQQVRESRGQDDEPTEVQRAIKDDPRLTASQRRALLESYDAFLKTRASTSRSRRG